MSANGRRLASRNRLHHRWEYLKFFSNAEVFRLSQCTVFRIPNTEGHFRLGITLKARGSSVERNRVKRKIRERFRNLGAELGAFDYNVVVPANKKMGHPYPLKLADALNEEFPKALRSTGAAQKKRSA